jgi:hypothetical protein
MKTRPQDLSIRHMSQHHSKNNIFCPKSTLPDDPHRHPLPPLHHLSGRSRFSWRESHPTITTTTKIQTISIGTSSWDYLHRNPPPKTIDRCSPTSTPSIRPNNKKDNEREHPQNPTDVYDRRHFGKLEELTAVYERRYTRSLISTPKHSDVVPLADRHAYDRQIDRTLPHHRMLTHPNIMSEVYAESTKDTLIFGLSISIKPRGLIRTI